MTTFDTIAAGLDRVRIEILRLNLEQPGEPRLQAERARRLAALHARRARWWGVLHRASGYRSGVHTVHQESAIAAQFHAESQVATWQQLADYWTQEAAA